MTAKPSFLALLLRPSNWGVALGLILMRLIVLAPYPLQLKLGSAIGILLPVLAPSRRRIVETNIRLCKPHLDRAEHKKVTHAVFLNAGIGLIETANAWWFRPAQFKGRVFIEGAEFLETALAQGKGAVLLGAHFSNLDLGGRLFSQYFPLNTVYRRHNNPLFHNFIESGRARFIEGQIKNNDFRSMIRLLKQNRILWFAPDQDHGMKNSVFVPFFGVSCATLTATERLVKLSKAPILLLTHHRDDQGQYHLKLHPPINPFPLDTPEESAQRINEELERGIEIDFAQYMWTHRRFKSHPKGKGYLYQDR